MSKRVKSAPKKRRPAGNDKSERLRVRVPNFSPYSIIIADLSRVKTRIPLVEPDEADDPKSKSFIHCHACLIKATRPDLGIALVSICAEKISPDGRKMFTVDALYYLGISVGGDLLVAQTEGALTHAAYTALWPRFSQLFGAILDQSMVTMPRVPRHMPDLEFVSRTEFDEIRKKRNVSTDKVEKKATQKSG